RFLRDWSSVVCSSVLGVRALRRYWERLRGHARERYEAGMEPIEAARDIPLSDFASWRDPERLVVNVMSLYREFAGASEQAATPRSEERRVGKGARRHT